MDPTLCCVWRSEGLGVSYKLPRKIREMMPLCNRVSLALSPVCKLDCVCQRRLGVFVSTPCSEHTCNFLSPYLQYNDRECASSYIVSRY